MSAKSGNSLIINTSPIFKTLDSRIHNLYNFSLLIFFMFQLCKQNT